MLMLISPAKTQDFTRKLDTSEFSIPEFIDKTALLVDKLKQMSANDISDLMNVSEKIAKTNYTRYKKFQLPFNNSNAKPAISVYKGDVYTSIDIDSYNEKDLAFAQDNLRIISGLYGLLKPLDLIQAYRLEMKINLVTPDSSNLYEFWGDALTQSLNRDIKNHDFKLIVNLASNEYFDAINPDLLEAKLLKITFKEDKDGVLKVIGILAKRARGMMVDYVIKNKINQIDQLKEFNTSGYKFDKSLSSDEEFVFTR
ncbi:MAG: peroxide stress protein YaaA [Vampirovibrionia bacterium]